MSKAPNDVPVLCSHVICLLSSTLFTISGKVRLQQLLSSTVDAHGSFYLHFFDPHTHSPRISASARTIAQDGRKHDDRCEVYEQLRPRSSASARTIAQDGRKHDDRCAVWTILIPHTSLPETASYPTHENHRIIPFPHTASGYYDRRAMAGAPHIGRVACTLEKRAAVSSATITNTTRVAPAAGDKKLS
ncbi:hypothetical protein DFJ77DRAFT_171625 [Powellomyces hirtus]|nr:hypothetical protein DFJ77DRAFT_171625 [Powellomyces hirtus]